MNAFTSQFSNHRLAAALAYANAPTKQGECEVDGCAGYLFGLDDRVKVGISGDGSVSLVT